MGNKRELAMRELPEWGCIKASSDDKAAQHSIEIAAQMCY